MKLSETLYVVSALGVVAASKTRLKASFAQSGPHVPESPEPLSNGP